METAFEPAPSSTSKLKGAILRTRQHAMRQPSPSGSQVEQIHNIMTVML